MQSEVLVLERRQLDLAAGTVRLDPGSTKNDEGRVVYLTPELIILLTAQVERVKKVEKRLGKIVRGDAVPARLPADRRPQHGERGDLGEGGHDDHRPQDAQRVRPLQHRQPGPAPGGRAKLPTVPFPIPFRRGGRNPAR
ncbi:MAG TPA: hypothetical protein VL086_16850 [Candidatus Nitrosotalea sp.]|nr:hypothetical protein [Candidatus Nitrosotalea sp.]